MIRNCFFGRPKKKIETLSFTYFTNPVWKIKMILIVKNCIKFRLNYQYIVGGV
ncbi:hypothetical protein ANACAC_02913 [Anaerostipes caccae L1-92]|uniref:Uncharacterized protein n=1 Tax=Anaerostipes caccae (strain DSM 14662 / CCUG 47493 / JCM 13470 / NCIMB 13811 / L1-92) TaxID=411490 RepID=B0MHF1_ANACD|nr:hypothetical protein ANACAC_02913 [Anaerostipes caccae L1-92]